MNGKPTRAQKRHSERARPRNISLPPELDRQVGAVLIKYGYGSFSDYVQAHIRKDAGLEFPQ